MKQRCQEKLSTCMKPELEGFVFSEHGLWLFLFAWLGLQPSTVEMCMDGNLAVKVLLTVESELKID